MRNRLASDSRFNRLAPPLLPFGTLHPIPVKLTQFTVGFRRESGELSHDVLEDLIIDPDTGVRG